MAGASRRASAREAKRAARLKMPSLAPRYYVRNIPAYELLGAEGIEIVHNASMRILEEIGVDFRDEESLRIWRQAGAKVEGQRVRIPRELAMEKVGLAPAEFTQNARNPERSVRIGSRHMVFGPVYGPPYVRDFDRKRRNSLLSDHVNFVKLTYMTPVLNYSGGLICEPMDVPVPKRHLDTLYAHIKYSDKPFMGAVTSPERAEDCVEMCRVLFGSKFVEENTVIMALLSANSPLVWDQSMLGALKVYARNNQALLLSPFIMQGANTAVTTASALAQLNAEAVAAIAFAQIVRPGVPVIYGNSLAAVSMQTGSPTYGGPETTMLMFAIGQLARRYGVPYRTGGTRNTSKAVDAQAGYESMQSLIPAVLAGANFILHAAGWTESGLSASYAKFVMDIDHVAILQRLLPGMDLSNEALAFDATREVGPGGHYFGTEHTIRHYETAFYVPMTVDRTARFEQWEEEGCKDMEARALEVALEWLKTYEPPPLDPVIDEALVAFLNKRKAELGD